MADDKALRAQLVKLLDFEEAHVGFDRAVKGIPPRLLEHLRIAQADILEFCLTATYKEKKWPDDYWPAALGPARRRSDLPARDPARRRSRRVSHRPGRRAPPPARDLDVARTDLTRAR